ncbi:MAG: membrane protein insertase YidC [Acidocella sp.]|nr:membrane protein insertase YidC [Acidocella sp.]
MDQKRLLLAIALSLGIMLVFQFGFETYLPHPAPPAQITAQTSPASSDDALNPNAGAPSAAQIAPVIGPVLPVDGPKLSGSITLTGAIFDNVVLKDYHDTVAPDSPLVQIMGRIGGKYPSYAQFGWTAQGGIPVPTNATLWAASAPRLTPQTPVTLSWDNGHGVTFELLLALDDHYMFTIQQAVINHTGAPISIFPWSRVVRDYQPVGPTSYILYEGPLGVFNHTLNQISYKTIKSDGTAAPGGQAFTETSPGGWIGITDKYWLTALAPDQAASLTGSMTYGKVTDGDGNAYQTSFITAKPLIIAPGATGSFQTHLFTGAKVVKLLDAYQTEYGIPDFYKSIDFGHLYFITKPIFFALDYLNALLGNFGLAIMVFTVGMKLLFFPLASYSYRSMGKMKLVQPKIKALREQFKDDNTKLQQATMALYKAEKINPASGCLPMLVQIPVFFSLYKVIFITIEMRQAPFYGWIKDLSVPDPTNLFNLFGLIPYDPTQLSPLLHLGALPIIMGITMFLQQRMNPAPPDPVQARMFQFMPIIFTFVLARSPAGLVLYWAWNNLLSVGQQWLIMRQTRQAGLRSLVKT